MKRTPTPAVLTDKALNRFITDVLLDAREKDAAGPALMTNTLIERTVEELRAFFPGAYPEVAPPAVGWSDGDSIERIGA